MQFIFFVKFFETNREFFNKIETSNKGDFLCWYKYKFYSDINYSEKSLICCKKFNIKDHITSIFQKLKPN